MATRSLTEVFILMRNNAVQNRNFYSEQNFSDRASLVHHEEGDLSPKFTVGKRTRMPPEWAESLEECQYTLSKIQTRLKELSSMQSKHLLRPAFDDTMIEEQQIDTLTQEVTKMFGVCHRCIQRIQQYSLSHLQGSPEAMLSKNVVASLVASLQNLSNTFRKEQSEYLNKIKSREERSQQYFGANKQPLFEDWSEPVPGRVVSQQQLHLLEENTQAVELREREIQHVVRSISDLNVIFKEISHMVADQGTILDRIDFNVEQAQVKVHEGLTQLQKADTYQKKNRKMMCIVIMTVSVIFLLIILIAVKS
uniref:EOG090X0AQP n=1 Tax=Lynceus sp. MCZ IZ 141354 TaxID=1930659 RepID=A0A9N6WUA0_9CRUS|nr:EOG090X0AQP [Lynceus sp. MCZ IZ 141354]